MSWITSFWLSILIGITSFLNAQPVYTAQDYADPGDVHIVTRVFAPQLTIHYFTIQKNGPNQTWDFSLMQGLLQKPRRFYDPSLAFDYAAAYIALCTASCLGHCTDDCTAQGDSCRANCTGPFASICTTACNTQESICNAACPATCSFQCLGNTTKWNLAEKRFEDIDLSPIIDFRMEENYDIMEVSNTLSNWAIAGRIRTTIANVPNAGLPVIIPYTDPDKKLEFPITYGTSFSDVSQYGLDLGAFGNVVNLNTDLAFEVTQERTTEVVGYGTIITPHGTYTNALKVRTLLHRELRVVINGVEVNTADFPGILRPDNLVEYMWFDPSEQIPVFRVFGTEKFGIETYSSAEYLDNPFNWPFRLASNEDNIHNSEKSIENTKVEVFPNPFIEDFNVGLMIPHSGHLNISVYDLLGRKLYSVDRNVMADEMVKENIPADILSSADGMYTVIVSLDGQILSRERAIRIER